MKAWQSILACLAVVVLAGCVSGPETTMAPSAPGGAPKLASAGSAQVAFTDFKNSAFPYHGMIPPDESGSKPRPFLDVDGVAHSSPRGGVLYANQTYNDPRVLIAAAPDFDPNSAAALVVLFHGNQATLERDVVERQQAPRQLAQSSLNAVLLAPQMAVDARDSSAGNFWRPGGLAAFLNEAEGKLAQMYPQASRATFHNMPVVIVAYSGGYLPAAFSLQHGGAGDRVRGVVLMDALFGEPAKFSDWVEKNANRAFFVSAYSASTKEQNLAFQARLRLDGVQTYNGLPQSLQPGVVAFVSAENANHDDFLTVAWTADPLIDVLNRMGR